ncbi:MAG: phosphoglycolate phosphatase [Thioalkalivibrionaceae bacterium]
MNWRPELILIDLDGTLVDSVPDLSFCVDETMQALGLPRRGEAAVRLWVGNGVERLVARALINALDGEPDEDLLARALPVFRDCYQANSARRSTVYPGVREGLMALRAADFKLGCVTNKARRFTEPLLDSLHLAPYFELLVAGDDLAQKKPDPAPLLHAAATLGAEPRRSLMVGDSKSDVHAARAAGFAVVCMRDGYNHGRDIREEHPDAVLERLDELPALLAAGAVPEPVSLRAQT